MLYLAIRTDSPEAELYLLEDRQTVATKTWHAHRQLAESLHKEIADLLEANARNLTDINGIVVFAGPGSFTGLRIGITVANALSYSLSVPVVGAKGDGWLVEGVSVLKDPEDDATNRIALPEYGAEPHITPQKH